MMMAGGEFTCHMAGLQCDGCSDLMGGAYAGSPPCMHTSDNI